MYNPSLIYYLKTRNILKKETITMEAKLKDCTSQTLYVGIDLHKKQEWRWSEQKSIFKSR